MPNFSDDRNVRGELKEEQKDAFPHGNHPHLRWGSFLSRETTVNIGPPSSTNVAAHNTETTSEESTMPESHLMVKTSV